MDLGLKMDLDRLKDPKKHEKEHLSGALFQIILGIVMLSIGAHVSFKNLLFKRHIKRNFLLIGCGWFKKIDILWNKSFMEY